MIKPKDSKSKNKNKQLMKSFEENLKIFRDLFEGDDGLAIRIFTNQEEARVRFCILFINGMVDVETVNRNIIQPIVQSTLPKDFAGNMDAILSRVVLSNYSEKISSIDELAIRITRGESVLLMEHSDEAIAICTKGWKSRAVTEPENEKVQRGPREGFVEPILVNLSMIRRKLATPDLKVKNIVIGAETRTDVSVCYLDSIANGQILEEIFDRLSKIDYDGIIESGYIAEFIEDSPYSPFDKIGSTERPDVAVSEMLEGRIVIVVDGTPTVLTLPFLFEEYFKSNEDDYLNFYYATIGKIIRMLSFIITITLPAFYVAILTYHQEMIPSSLLMSLSAAREGIPFPTIVETMGLLFVFEILREAGLRMPIQIGQSLSILGALVLGTAAVEARIVSASVIIVVALSGLTGLLSIKIKGPIITLRFILVLLAGFMGLYGLFFGIMGMTLHLCSLRSFGIPYLLTFTSLKPEDIRDILIRAPIWFVKKRPAFASGKNKRKQGKRTR